MFKEIKEGDFVLAPVFLRKCAFDRHGKLFYCKAKVTATTPKRFTVLKSVYKKLDGSNIAKSEQYRSPYKNCKPYLESSDETQAYYAAKKLDGKCNTLYTLLREVDVYSLSEDKVDNLLLMLKER